MSLSSSDESKSSREVEVEVEVEGPACCRRRRVCCWPAAEVLASAAAEAEDDPGRRSRDARAAGTSSRRLGGGDDEVKSMTDLSRREGGAFDRDCPFSAWALASSGGLPKGSSSPRSPCCRRGGTRRAWDDLLPPATARGGLACLLGVGAATASSWSAGGLTATSWAEDAAVAAVDCDGPAMEDCGVEDEELEVLSAGWAAAALGGGGTGGGCMRLAPTGAGRPQRCVASVDEPLVLELDMGEMRFGREEEEEEGVGGSVDCRVSIPSPEVTGVGPRTLGCLSIGFVSDRVLHTNRVQGVRATSSSPKRGSLPASWADTRIISG